MGKASRAKKNRTPAPYSRLSLSSYLPDGSTALFVIGIFVLGYGTAVCSIAGRITPKMPMFILYFIHGPSFSGWSCSASL